MELINIELIKENPTNPRNITEEQLRNLQRSLNEFPDMLKIRPIIVNQDNIILGGNMRYKAAKLNGLKEVWVERVNIEKQKEKELVIKDNINSGSWNFNYIAEEFDITDVSNWGLAIPEWYYHQEDITKHEIEEHRRHGYGTESLILTYPIDTFNQIDTWVKTNKIKLDLYIKERLL